MLSASPDDRLTSSALCGLNRRTHHRVRRPQFTEEVARMSEHTSSAAAGTGGQMRTLATASQRGCVPSWTSSPSSRDAAPPRKSAWRLSTGSTRPSPIPKCSRRLRRSERRSSVTLRPAATLLPRSSAGMAKQVVAVVLEFRLRRAPHLVGPRAPTSNTTRPFERFALGHQQGGNPPRRDHHGRRPGRAPVCFHVLETIRRARPG